MTAEQKKLAETLRLLIGKKCWEARAGVIDSAFSLDFGEKIPLVDINGRMTMFQGELILMVWCVWRLDGQVQPIASSDQDKQKIAEALHVLVGKKVINAHVVAPAWDLQIEFEGDLRLNVFCEFIPDEPSFDTNWHIDNHDELVAVVAGYDILVEPAYRSKLHLSR
jgi:hypothetical protein